MGSKAFLPQSEVKHRGVLMTRISDSYLIVVEVTREQSVTEDKVLIKGRWGEDCLDHREAALK